MTASNLVSAPSAVSDTAVLVRWLALEGVAPGAWEALARLLDDDELARAARFSSARDRQAHVAAHALVRVLLSSQAPRPPEDWRFAANAHGRPEVAGEPGVPPLRFNLSHTRGLVAVAVTLTHDVGIDAEAIEPRRLRMALAERFFAPAEVALVKALPEAERAEALFALWTLKEACLKAMGRGLAVPLDAFALTLAPLGVSFRDALAEDPRRWLLRRLRPTPAHALALALRHPEPASVAVDAAATTASELLALAAQWRPGAGQTGRR